MARIALRWLGLFGASLLVGGAVLLARLRERLDDDVAGVVAARWTTVARLAFVLTLAGVIAAVVSAAGAVPAAPDVGAPRHQYRHGRPGPPGRSGGRRPPRGYSAARAPARRVPRDGRGLLPRRGGGRGPHHGHHVVVAVPGHPWPRAPIWPPPPCGSAVWRCWPMPWPPSPLPPARRRCEPPPPVLPGGDDLRRGGDRDRGDRLDPGGRAPVLPAVVGLRPFSPRQVGAGGGHARARRAGRPGGGRPKRCRSGAHPAGGGLLRTEAALGVGVLVFAATLVGVAQGRGQPLPAQKGSAPAGPALANTVVGGGLVREALSPAAPGRNRITALLANPVEAATAGVVEPSAAVPGEQEKVSVSLTCDCAAGPIEADLTRATGAWRADVDLPKAGVWRASLIVGGSKSLAPVALRVATGDAPGAPAYEISSIGDLSGGRPAVPVLPARPRPGPRPAQRQGRGRREKGSGPGQDDGGDPARARQLAEDDRGASLAVPCGTTAASRPGSCGGGCRSSSPTVWRRRWPGNGSSGSREIRTPKVGRRAEPWPERIRQPDRAPRRISVVVERTIPPRPDRGRCAGGVGPRPGPGREGRGRSRRIRPTSRSSSCAMSRAARSSRWFRRRRKGTVSRQRSSPPNPPPSAPPSIALGYRDRSYTGSRGVAVLRRDLPAELEDRAAGRREGLRRGRARQRRLAPVHEAGQDDLPRGAASVDGLRGYMAGKTILAALEKGSSVDSLVGHSRYSPLKSESGSAPRTGSSPGGAPPRRRRDRGGSSSTRAASSRGGSTPVRRRAGPVLRRGRRLEPGRHRQRRPVRAPAQRRRPHRSAPPYQEVRPPKKRGRVSPA